MIVTCDARGFLWPYAERIARRERTAGLLLVSTRRYPLRDRGGLVRALVATIGAGDALAGAVRWLE